MAAATRRTDEDSTRSRILEAALELFSRQGFAGASMRRLAVAVGLTPSSLYNHFAGKEAIYHALVDTFGPAGAAERLRSPRFRALGGDPAGFCRLYAEELLTQWMDPREQRFQELITAERNRLPSVRSHAFSTLFIGESGLVADYFRRFALAGLIDTSDPQETARLFMAGLTFVRLEHFIFPATPSPPAVVRPELARFLQNFLSLVGARSPAM
jgi:AcrR family transcriptional regulator